MSQIIDAVLLLIESKAAIATTFAFIGAGIGTALGVGIRMLFEHFLKRKEIGLIDVLNERMEEIKTKLDLQTHKEKGRFEKKCKLPQSSAIHYWR
jgi:hypothetical protein